MLLIGADRGDEVAAIRETGMRAGSAARPHRIVATTVVTLGDDASTAAAAFVEGFLLGSYRFDRHRSDAEPARTTSVKLLVAAGDRAAKRGMERGTIVGAATNWARDLTNAPASESTPAMIATKRSPWRNGSACPRRCGRGARSKAAASAGSSGVGAGSANEPRLVELAYRGAGRARPIAVTGKGVTFDSGGLNVKRTSEMAWMRSDEAGGAAALATVRAVAELGLERQRRRGGAVRREHARRQRDPPRRRRASPRRPDV